MAAQPHSELRPARRMTPADEEFYPAVAIQALTRIFKDPSLTVHHGMVMQATMFILIRLVFNAYHSFLGWFPTYSRRSELVGQQA